MDRINKMLELLEHKEYDQLRNMLLHMKRREHQSYLKTNVIRIFSKRIPWLLMLMISAVFTGGIISTFESALAAKTVLVSYIPMLMGAGGNAGIQASVAVIRGLSLRELQFRDYFRVLWKEVQISILCGMVLAGGNFLKIILIDNFLLHFGVSLPVAGVICLTLFITVVLSKVIGCSLPMLAERFGFDPAVMASPFITTIVDALSLLIYFVLSRSLLSI